MVIHPQSIVHSLVSYVDGSVPRSWATPTCAPHAHALAWPDRMPSGVDALIFRIGRLSEEPDLSASLLRLAAGAAAAGGKARRHRMPPMKWRSPPFEGMLPFTAIAQVVETVLNSTISCRSSP